MGLSFYARVDVRGTTRARPRAYAIPPVMFLVLDSANTEGLIIVVSQGSLRMISQAAMRRQDTIR